MSMDALGPTLDLHGGGTDLIFPHHECEIAQSESVTGQTFSRHWMHSAMVSYEGEKMSKSLGNLVFVSDLLKVADPRAIRLALMRHHYRAGFEWHDTDLDEGNALLAPSARRRRAQPTAPIRARTQSGSATRSTPISNAPKALEALDDLAERDPVGRFRSHRSCRAPRAGRPHRRRPPPTGRAPVARATTPCS